MGVNEVTTLNVDPTNTEQAKPWDGDCVLYRSATWTIKAIRP